MPTPSVNLRTLLQVMLSVALVACLASAAWACPTCREDLANSPQGRGLAAGFYYSILFMMSMPFLIMGTLGTVAYRSVKRAQAERDAAASSVETQRP
jgi:hypothetical protein